MEANVIILAAILLFFVGTLVWAIARSVNVWRLQRSGLRVRGEVTDVDTSQRRWHGGVTPRPIVRYFVDGQWIQVTLGNYTGRLPNGTAVDLVVDPKRPEQACFAYGNEFSGAIVICALFILLGGLLLRSMLAGR